MLRIDRNQKALITLERKTMRESGYWERRDIQEMICRNPRPFCEEIDEHFLIVGKKVEPTNFLQDRIGLLGIDPDGMAVVIELKRDTHKLHLLQALSYAGMVAKWEPKRFIEELSKFNREKQMSGKFAKMELEREFEKAKEEVDEFLEEEKKASIELNASCY